MDLSKLMSAAGELRTRMEDAQATARQTRCVGEAGGGLVRVTVDGQFQVLKVDIDGKAISSDGTALLEDLVRAACNDAFGKVQGILKSQLGDMAMGMGLPSGLSGVG